MPDPLSRRPRRPALPHRRSGPAARGRRPRVPRPHRPSGEDPRLPDRAGRDRGRRSRSTRRCARPWCSRARTCPATSVSSPTWRRRATTDRSPTRSALTLKAAAARLHGARGVRLPGRAAADRQRQGGPEGAACPRGPARRARGLRASTRRGGGSAGAHLGGRAARAPVGIHDNFFELGGDSILSIQVIARARAAGLRLTPRDLFKQPTVAELAASLGATRAAAPTGRRQRSARRSRRSNGGSSSSDSRTPTIGTRRFLFVTPPDLDAERLEAALQQVVRHHDAFRLRFRGRPRWRAAVVRRRGEPSAPSADRSGVDARRRARRRPWRRPRRRCRAPWIWSERRWRGRPCPPRPRPCRAAVARPASSDRRRRVLAHPDRGSRARVPPVAATRSACRRGPLPASSGRERLAERAATGAFRPALPYWIAAGQRVTSPRRTIRVGANVEESARTVVVSLDASETQALLQSRARRLSDADQRRPAHGSRPRPGRLDRARSRPHRSGGTRPRGPLRRRGPLAHRGLVHDIFPVTLDACPPAPTRARRSRR